MAAIVRFAFLFLIGLTHLVFPRTIRKYDKRMTRYINRDGEYIVACYVLAMIYYWVAGTICILDFWRTPVIAEAAAEDLAPVALSNFKFQI